MSGKGCFSYSTLTSRSLKFKCKCPRLSSFKCSQVLFPHSHLFYSHVFIPHTLAGGYNCVTGETTPTFTRKLWFTETSMHLINHFLKGQYWNHLPLGWTYRTASKAGLIPLQHPFTLCQTLPNFSSFGCIECLTDSQLWTPHLWTIPSWENSAATQSPKRRKETPASRKRSKYIFKYKNEQGRWSKVHSPFLWLSLVFVNGFSSPRQPVQAHLIECGKILFGNAFKILAD